jgi:hypothetical protein
MFCIQKTETDRQTERYTDRWTDALLNPAQTSYTVQVRNKTVLSPAKFSPLLFSVARYLTLFWRQQSPRKGPGPLCL